MFVCWYYLHIHSKRFPIPDINIMTSHLTSPLILAKLINVALPGLVQGAGDKYPDSLLENDTFKRWMGVIRDCAETVLNQKLKAAAN